MEDRRERPGDDCISEMSGIEWGYKNAAGGELYAWWLSNEIRFKKLLGTTKYTPGRSKMPSKTTG